MSNNLPNNNNNQIYFYFLFIKGGLCLFEKKIDNDYIFKNEEETNNFKLLIKKIATRFLNNNGNTDLFLFNRFLTDKLKIVILLKSNIALVGAFPLKSSKGFQNLLLIHLYISLINFKGDSIKKINLMSKYITNNKNNNNFYTYKEFIEENKEKINNNENKALSNIDFLELSIYDKYFLIYCIIHFKKVINIILKREDIDLAYTKFLNLYIIDISSDQLLFDLKKEQNVDIIKYFLNNNLFKEILYHSHQLYDSYIEKYSLKFTKTDSSQWFVKFECTSTYPRMLFIIKFIPILKGIVIVHIYYQKKLSRNMNNNSLSINPDNRYKEVDLVFGSYLNENQGLDFKYVMPKKLTEIENFCEEFYITTRTCDLFKLNDSCKEFKYFNYNIINIINTISIDVKNSTLEKIFEYINDKIKKQHIEEHNKNPIKIKHCETKKEENKKKEIQDEDIFLIDKNMVYNHLFKNNDKNSTIQINDKIVNYSTIKSNKNIINILRESPENSISNTLKKRKENEEIKTITLVSESNLISKEDNCSNNAMLDNFPSLVSEIKKKENKLFSKNKKNNIQLKKMKLQDLLINSSSINDISSSQNSKDKGKIEESESDLINKETSKNLMIKNEDENKGKTRNRLKLFNNDIDFQNEEN